jgi:CBS domain-containing protein
LFNGYSATCVGKLPDSWRNDPLAEVMTGNVIRIHADDSLYDAQKLMTQSKLARLVVTDRSGRLRGMITRRDVVRFLSQDKTGRPLDEMRVREAMSEPVLTLRPTDTIADAARAMNKKGVSSIVVTDSADEILGIVTKTDLCFHFSLLTSNEKVKDFMTRKVFTVRPTHSIFFVTSLLAKQGISRVPVVDGKLTGMITLSDIVRSAPGMRAELAPSRDRAALSRGLLVPTAKLTALTALDIMTTKPITVTPEDLLYRAAEVMIERGISGLPVVDSKGNVRGIVTKTDIVRAIAA